MRTVTAKLVGPKKFKIMEVELPQLINGEVLIEIISCGICSSEFPIYNGELIGTPGVSFRYKKYPADLGHEVVGKIVNIGKGVKNFEIGDLVTGMTYSGCGFAQHMNEKSVNLVKIPKNIKIKTENVLGEPIMAIVNILRQIVPDFGDDILIIGDGFMSLLTVAGLSHYPISKLIVIGHHENRLSLAKGFGATNVINSKICNAWEEVMKITNKKGVEVSIEFAGTSTSLRLAASLCKAKSRAKLVLAASYNNDMPFTIGNYLQNRAPIIIPAYPNQSLNKINDMKSGLWGLEKGIFSIEKLITHKFKLSEINKAMEIAMTRHNGYIKGIILP
ncbi:hypothetical protein E3V08_00385 [Candidatus Atribacteria bacterium MT.SAG.1]|nr:hypothetical protein E3V08_00385 [Candidatus Atribacteria bacterium MT.SAG.1]